MGHFQIRAIKRRFFNSDVPKNTAMPIQTCLKIHAEEVPAGHEKNGTLKIKLNPMGMDLIRNSAP